MNFMHNRTKKIYFLIMRSQKEAIEFARKFNWTKKDAERAFTKANLNIKEADEQTLLISLVEFAGLELLERQRLQAAQKGQVTKKVKYIKEIEIDFAEKVNEYEKTLHQERSVFVNLIKTIYQFAKPLGFQDPWIEALLAKYNEYQNDKLSNPNNEAL